jgi:hypothetical protein
MLPTVAASAAAARALGYAGLADLIEIEQLSPQRILMLFRLSMSETASHDAVVALFAGSIARYRAAPQEWDGHLEEQLASTVSISFLPHHDVTSFV